MAAMSLCSSLAIPIRIAAQEAQQLPQDAQRYTVTDLGTLSGGNFSQPFFITKNGHIAGYSNSTVGTYHAVIWSGKQTADLGTLGGSNSIGFGENVAGQAGSGRPKLLPPIRMARISAASVPT